MAERGTLDLAGGKKADFYIEWADQAMSFYCPCSPDKDTDDPIILSLDSLDDVSCPVCGHVYAANVHYSVTVTQNGSVVGGT